MTINPVHKNFSNYSYANGTAPAVLAQQISSGSSLKNVASFDNAPAFSTNAGFASTNSSQDVSSALYQIISILQLLVESLAQPNAFTQSQQANKAQDNAGSTDSIQKSSKNKPKSTSTDDTGKSGTSGNVIQNDAIDWGAPSTKNEDPNGAYQVPGGFEPPKGNEKADAATGVTADPGNIQAADSAPDDSKSHSQAAGTKQQHSMAQVDQMYGDIVDKELAKYNAKYGTNCPRQVILGIIYQESQGDPNTFGTDDPAQSRGLMQVTADNAAREFPGKNQYNPEVIIETGVEAFTRTLSQSNGNLMQALASYNQGKPTTSQGKAYAQWVKLWASQVPAQ